MSSVILLGLTGAHIHHTCEFGYHDPIIAELLSTAVFTILWVPFVFLTLLRPTFGRFRHVDETSMGAERLRGAGAFTPEVIGWFVLWVLWLVGVAVSTVSFNANILFLSYCEVIHDNFFRLYQNKWPSKSICGPGNQCRILTAINAFSWITWSILTIIGALGLAHYASLTGPGAGYSNNSAGIPPDGTIVREKPAEVPLTTQAVQA